MEAEEMDKEVLEDMQVKDASQSLAKEDSETDEHLLLSENSTNVSASNPDGTPVFSTMTLSDSSGFFLEQIENESILKNMLLQGAKSDVGLDEVPGVQESSILLHVDENATPQIHLTQSSAQNNSANLDDMGDNNIPTTMYTIHLTETAESEGEKTEGTLNLEGLVASDGKVILHEQPLSVDLPFLSSPSRLEEFMDIVTTYKCKFCRFSCAWKSGLMSHIRSCHLEANQRNNDGVAREDGAASSSAEKETVAGIANGSDEKAVSKKVIDIVDVPMPDKGGQSSEAMSQEIVTPTDIKEEGKMQDRHIFLCGQCSKGFASLELCKKHMVNDHDLKLGTRGERKHRKRARKIVSNPSIRENLLELEGEERLPKNKKIRTAKVLEEDFFLEPKRKRIRRDCTADRSYRCSEKGCGYRFKTDTNLQYHKRCHTREEKAFGCPECGERFEHWRGLVIHLWKLHSINLDLYSCHVCNYKSYSLFKLENHQRIHSDTKEFTCAICGKSFKQISQLRNHHVIHLDRKNLAEKRWYSEQECEICGRHFSDSKCLRKHQQAVHSKMKPYVCTFCGHASARKAMLQLHMRQHTGDKPFLCEHCDYRTGDHNSLRRHRMRHTGAKPYKCPHCSYACIQAISYKTHLKNKHPGLDGLFACQYCNFRSVNKENFSNHMADHNRGFINTDDPDSIVIEEDQTPAQLHLPESTLQQLEGILPGNVLAAHLIYNCLNAISQDGGASNLPPGVTSTNAGDGTQTITIQLPSSNQSSGDAEQYFFTIQQQDGGSLVYSSDSIVTEGLQRDKFLNESDSIESSLDQSNTVIHELEDGHSTDDVLTQEKPVSG